MIVRELDTMSQADLDAFATVFKQSKEQGVYEGAIRLLQPPNGGMLCFDEQGVPCGAITYSDLPRVNAFGIGWICIPVKHKRYGEIFNTMFDEVYRLAGDRNVFMELDMADKQNVQLAEARSFRKLPIDYCTLDVPGVPQESKEILLVRSRGPVDNYADFLKAWFTYGYMISDVESDERFQHLVEQVRPLEHKF